jgi:hypothetical protein
MWQWIWPRVGATPSSQNTDSEMFDRADYPYTETFVREAIQNTLDARQDTNAPAVIRFAFHRDGVGNRREFIAGAVENRLTAGFPPIPEWNKGEIDWVTIEDFNTKGLDGKLDDRLGNFWNYWLNFGVSNKDGAKRGGRGIGRVTFLIASRMQTVMALTRRVEDDLTVSCGMCLLRTMRTQNGAVRTTHAYLAESECEDVFKLHDSANFSDNFASAFRLNGYATAPKASGLALVIPYPHADLSPEGILASSIEHFAPAILNDSLVVEVDETVLNTTTIDVMAESLAPKIHTASIGADVERYLDLIRTGLSECVELRVDVTNGLSSLRESAQVKSMREACLRGEKVSLRLAFEITKGSEKRSASLRAVIARAPTDCLPIDRLFREGMSLPEVKASNPGELDLVMIVDEENLATFLNLCEGKAHLDLLESKEIRAKLEANEYHSPISIKRFVKTLPNELRTLFTPEITEPEKDVFDSFFALPDESSEKRKIKGGKPDVTPPTPLPPPPPRISPIVVETLNNGFRVKANTAYDSWPVNVSVSMAYADGTRSPDWSPYDFTPADLVTTINDCESTFVKNKVTAKNCGSTLSIEITGFDARRELETHVKVWKNAQND